MLVHEFADAVHRLYPQPKARKNRPSEVPPTNARIHSSWLSSISHVHVWPTILWEEVRSSVRIASTLFTGNVSAYDLLLLLLLFLFHPIYFYFKGTLQLEVVAVGFGCGVQRACHVPLASDAVFECGTWECLYNRRYQFPYEIIPPSTTTV